MYIAKVAFINTRAILDEDLDCDLNVEEWQTEDNYEIRFVIGSKEEKIKTINYLLNRELINGKEYTKLRKTYIDYIVLYH